MFGCCLGLVLGCFFKRFVWVLGRDFGEVLHFLMDLAAY